MAHAGGRPSKYGKNTCKRAAKLFAEGKSIVQVAAELNVSRDTIYAWAKEHNEFSDTLTVGLAKAEAYWEQIAQLGGAGQMNVSPGLLSLILKCRYHWTETQDVNITGDMGITTITSEERDKRITDLLAKANGLN